MTATRIQKKIKIIAVSPDVKKEIAAELGCTLDTVYNALNLTDPTVGDQPDRIRMMAKARGGVETFKIKWIRL